MLPDVDDDVVTADAIHDWLRRLVAERQSLRDAAADTTALERYRLEIARLQHAA